MPPQKAQQTERLMQIESAVRSALSRAPDAGKHHYALGQILARRGRHLDALASFEKTIQLRPQWSSAYIRAGEMLARLGRLEEGLRALERAVRLKPDHARARRQLGHLYAFLGKYAKAASAYQRALRIEPLHAVTHMALGTSLQNGGDFHAAARCYRRAIDLDPGLADAHSNLATALQGLGLPDEAEPVFRKALELAPDHTHALAGLASILEIQARFHEGLALIAHHATRESADIELITTYARLKNRLGEHREGIRTLEGALRKGPVGSAQRRRMHFVLGDCYDAVSEFESAFSHYRAGNILKPGRFDPDNHRAQIETLIRTFDGAFVSRPTQRNPGSEKLVFIVGMPRSGSSLVEQILAAHPDIHACGERDDIAKLVMSLDHEGRESGGYPRCLAAITSARLETAAQAYLTRNSAEQGEALRITDKSPGNFLHLGLIERLFPACRIVHCVRHPLDTGLSCYFQDFAGQTVPFAQNLEHIGIYYREYRRIMSHWQNTLSLPIMDVHYEELVAEPERIAREMVGFLGLEWSDNCTRHHEIERVVLTASSAQARRPVYQHSVRRFRNYEQFLAPLRHGLGSASS